MSFGFSPSDIRLAWELGCFLHEKCFTRAQGADILYLQFGREIEFLSESLKQLGAVINNADSQRPRRRWGNPDQESRVALQPVCQAVGDFRKTLDECEKLLNDHERFRRNPAGFVDNVVWHVSTQRDVEILKGRVHFHATKLLIITKPFEIQLLLEIRRQLQDVQRDVSEIKGLLVSLLRNEEPTLDTLFAAQRIAFPAIPDEIADKFTIWLAMNPPDEFRDVSSIPLKEGFDALVYHFAQVRYQLGFGWQCGTPYLKWDVDRLPLSCQSRLSPRKRQDLSEPYSPRVFKNSHRSDVLTDFIVNTDITRVVPAYATPGGNINSYNLLLSNRHVQDLRWQYLRNDEGMLSETPQHALILIHARRRMEPTAGLHWIPCPSFHECHFMGYKRLIRQTPQDRKSCSPNVAAAKPTKPHRVSRSIGVESNAEQCHSNQPEVILRK
ncbi:MAG: hypothetical protein Q9204_004060 [Flavoplaca sp. TL-2023a]